MNTILTIDGINLNNEAKVFRLIGNAGYDGAHQWKDDCSITLNIQDKEFRQKAGIREIEVTSMIGNLILKLGCTVEVKHEG
jgi:hypothetical protein